jgi:hypothetical protein
MDLPSWLDIPKIMALGGLVMLIVQYVKAYIPEKAIKPSALLIGILVAIGCECYTSGVVGNWAKTIINGIIAGIVSDGAYSFLSSKGGQFALPSKSTLNQPPKP